MNKKFHCPTAFKTIKIRDLHLVEQFAESHVVRFASQVQTEQGLEELFGLAVEQVALRGVVKAVEQLDQQNLRLTKNVAGLLLQAIFELVENIGQQKAHQEIQTKNQVADEEEHIPIVFVVRRQHDVWEVSCCHKDNHVVERIFERVEVSEALVRVAEQIESRQGVRSDKHEDCDEELRRVLHVVDKLFKIRSDQVKEIAENYWPQDIRDEWSCVLHDRKNVINYDDGDDDCKS